MASLASKDSYLQSLGRKVCAQESSEPRKRKLSHTGDGTEPRTAGKKKKRNKKPRNLRHDGGMQRFPPKMSNSVVPKFQRKDAPLSSFSTVDLLKKRLHEKIEESRGQHSNKPAEEIEKVRQRRKHERERKKRKRKELRLKASEETQEEEAGGVEKTVESRVEETCQVPLVFNKVIVNDEPLNKIKQKKEKKERVKGNITPMTGKNYKQLLSRLEQRKSKLEELRGKDQEKAKEFESKIKWTNVLYKAEGLKIKDDEGMLKNALKRKEKRREQRKKNWDKRVLHTTEKIQQRQEKRKRNINKKKVAKIEKKKNRARKKGRILPEDLAKAK